MTTPLQCLVAFALWTLALVLVGVGPWRIGQVLMNTMRANSFPSGQPHGPEWYQRLNRAHANAVENLPVFAALVIAGEVSGLARTVPLLTTLPLVIVVARLGQSVAHISSGRSVVVNIRFTFFIVQAVSMAIMGALLLRG